MKIEVTAISMSYKMPFMQMFHTRTHTHTDFYIFSVYEWIIFIQRGITSYISRLREKFICNWQGWQLYITYAPVLGSWTVYEFDHYCKKHSDLSW